jgi:hypothetical protein
MFVARIEAGHAVDSFLPGQLPDRQADYFSPSDAEFATIAAAN